MLENYRDVKKREYTICFMLDTSDIPSNTLNIKFDVSYLFVSKMHLFIMHHITNTFSYVGIIRFKTIDLYGVFYLSYKNRVIFKKNIIY